MTPEQLKARSKRFALEVIALVSTLPRTLVAEIIARQIVRSGTRGNPFGGSEDSKKGREGREGRLRVDACRPMIVE